MKKNKSRRIDDFNYFLAVLVLLGLAASIAKAAGGKTDAYIRHRIVRIKSEHGMCTAEQIRAPSGKDYLLSAAHCIPIANNGVFHVITEEGKMVDRRLLAEDPNSDLILIEGLDNVRGLDIADSAKAKQEVRTFTHGHDFDTYKTEGVLIQDYRVEVPIDLILSPADYRACVSKPKYEIVRLLGIIPMCALNVIETVSTAKIVPGSSGGPVVNSKGALVGVCSAGDSQDGFSFFVRLSDIRKFLEKY